MIIFNQIRFIDLLYCDSIGFETELHPGDTEERESEGMREAEGGRDDLNYDLRTANNMI